MQFPADPEQGSRDYEDWEIAHRYPPFTSMIQRENRQTGAGQVFKGFDALMRPLVPG